MEAPDRKANVQKAIEPFAYLWDKTLNWPRGMDNYEDRVRCLLPKVCETLNLIDRGQWGVLHKMDRGPKGVGYVPYDIVVWEPTKEHFDIFTDDADARWGKAGVFTDKDWSWLDARAAVSRGLIPNFIPVRPGASQPTPTPTPEPGTGTGSPALDRIFEELDELRADVSGLARGQSDIQSRLQALELLMPNSESVRNIVSTELAKWAQTPAEDVLRDVLMSTRFVGRVFGQRVVFNPERG